MSTDGSSGQTGTAEAGGAEPNVDVRRSPRRRKTVSAYRDGERTVVLIPARMSRAEERRWVTIMVDRLAAQDARLRPSDKVLADKARELSRRWLDGQARPSSVRWATNQGSRWGSCTPEDRTIRLSTRLRGMPSWVLDYVLIHELAHLLVPGHGPEFWAHVDRYPRTERARGFLEGVSATAGLGMSDADAAPVGSDADAEPESDSAPALTEPDVKATTVNRAAAPRSGQSHKAAPDGEWTGRLPF